MLCSICTAHAQLSVQAFDGSPGTKWLDFGGSGSKTTWLSYALPAARQPVQLASYSLTSANDSPERDPAAWVLEGRERTGTGLLCLHTASLARQQPAAELTRQACLVLLPCVLLCTPATS